LTEINTIGVIGAGQMGQGIAQVAAQSGLDVLVLDANAELARGSVERIGRALQGLVGKGKLPSTNRDDVLARIEAKSDFSELNPCDFVIEAAPERESVCTSADHLGQQPPFAKRQFWVFA